AHQAGHARVTEVRGSDYLGAGAASLLTMAVLPKVLAGKKASVPADLDAPHSWTYIGDVARLLVAAATDERGWGEAWNVPTPPPLSIRDVVTLACEQAGATAPKLSVMPDFVLRIGGLFNPTVRELPEMAYQVRKPFILVSSAEQ